MEAKESSGDLQSLDKVNCCVQLYKVLQMLQQESNSCFAQFTALAQFGLSFAPTHACDILVNPELSKTVSIPISLLILVPTMIYLFIAYPLAAKISVQSSECLASLRTYRNPLIRSYWKSCRVLRVQIGRNYYAIERQTTFRVVGMIVYWRLDF